MTIEEAKHHLNTWSTTHGSGQTTDKQHEEAKKIAIDTMRKYQAIEKIYMKWRRNYDMPTSVAWAELIGVLENVVEE